MNIITTIFQLIIAHSLHNILHTVQSWSIYKNWSEHHHIISVGAGILYESVSEPILLLIVTSYENVTSLID